MSCGFNKIEIQCLQQVEVEVFQYSSIPSCKCPFQVEVGNVIMSSASQCLWFPSEEEQQVLFPGMFGESERRWSLVGLGVSFILKCLSVIAHRMW